MSESETAEFVRWLQEDGAARGNFRELDRAWKNFDRVGALRPGAGLRTWSCWRAGASAPMARSRGWRWRRRRCWRLVWVVQSRFPRPAIPRRRRWARFKNRVARRLRRTAQHGQPVDVRYSPTERSVRLVRGEAHVTVVKNPAGVRRQRGSGGRARGGHGFSPAARRDHRVLVTEGRVQVNETAQGRSLLGVAGRTVVRRASRPESA